MSVSTSPEKPKIDPSSLGGWKYVERFRLMINDILAKRAPESIHPSELDPRRTFHIDAYFTLLLFAYLNPVLKSARALHSAMSYQEISERLGVEAFCHSSFSEAQSVFDPNLLAPIVQNLSEQLAGSEAGRVDPRLQPFRKALCAVDSTVLHALPRMTWAIYQTDTNRLRLHTQLHILSGALANATLTPGAKCERQALKENLQPGAFYIGDRYYGLEYGYFSRLEKAGCDYVIRTRDHPTIARVDAELPLSEADRAHGVISDQIVVLGNDGHFSAPLRLVVIETEGRRIVLVTNRRDLPAELIGHIYRQRWLIEHFFKWLKCVLKHRHWLLESPRGAQAQIYTMLVIALMLALANQGRPNKRLLEAIQLNLCGLCSDEELRALLERQLAQKAARQNAPAQKSH